MRFAAARLATAALAATALAVAVFAAAVAPAALRAQVAPAAADAPFEGVVTMNVGERPAPMVYSVRRGIMRLDVGGGPGGRQASVILDAPSHRMLVLVPAQQMYIERPYSPDSVAEAHRDRSHITRTGRMEQVAGYSCEHWTVKDDEGHTADACMAKGIGAFAGMQGPAGRRSAWLNELGEGGWFPLKVTREGGATPVLEVTKIERRTVEPSLFSVPDGWRKMELPAGMGRP